MPERGPDHELEHTGAALFAALTVLVASCSADLKNVVNQPQGPKSSTEARNDNPATPSSPEPAETEKSPLEQLRETKKDLEAQIITFKGQIGRLENMQRTKKGGLDNVETAQLLFARKYLVEAGEVLERVNMQIKLISTVDRMLGPDDGGSIWEHPNDEELLEE